MSFRAIRIDIRQGPEVALEGSDDLQVLAELFPVPEAGGDRDGQREPELMGEHADLPAMMGFVSEHVTEHLRADGPRTGPAVSAKSLDAAAGTGEGFGEHLRAASGALGQSRAGLARRAVRAMELPRDLEVRSGEPDPLAANIVHMGEDRGDGADLAGRSSGPGGRLEVFDENLVHALVGGEDLGGGKAELSLGLGLTRGHG